MNGHSESCSLKPGEDCYKWFWQTLDFTNESTRFLVIVGVQDDTLDAASEGLTIRNVTGGTDIDSYVNLAFGVAASEMMVGLPRRMLVPPGGVIDGTAGVGISLVSCCCLEKALAIL